MGSNDVESLWTATTRETDYDPLRGTTRVDVVVVGGGIAGLTTAIECIDAGYDVAVVEANRIISGTTANTTAKLTSQHGLIYAYINSTFGLDRGRQYAAANEAAITDVEERIDDLGVDAKFSRTESYVYATEENAVPRLHREARAAQRVGLPADVVDTIPGPVEASAALRFRSQAQFHPRAYLLAVAEEIDARGGSIYEQSRATGLSAGSPCRVTTEEGTIVADHVVMASLFPFADRGAYFSRMHPSRAYLLAVEVDEELPDGMYLSTESPPATFRSYRDLLIVGGQSHETSESGPSTSERFRRCERLAHRHFSVTDVVYRWEAHDFVPVDRIPFIGPVGRLAPNTYVATGFAKWGMTGGTAAGIIISDLIDTGESPWAEVFDPSRFTPKSLSRFTKENLTVAGRWVGDRMRYTLPERVAELERGDGCVVRHRGRPVAVHRDAKGELQATSAVCPHMWCLVEWNDAATTWDCPCHGSRFEAGGGVLTGPAKDPLKDRDIE